MKFTNLSKILSYEEVLSFGKAQRNRKVTTNHVNDFYNRLNDIKERKYTVYSEDGDGTYLVYGPVPIIVNPLNNHILDGQNRLEAFIKAYRKGLIDDKARINVAYWRIDDEEIENALIIDLNSISKNWSIDDYMNSYSQYLEYYQKLKEFCEGHELCLNFNRNGEKNHKYRYAAAIIKGMNQTSVLKKGAFTCTDEELKMADTIHRELCEIRKKLNLPMNGNDIEAMAIEWHTQRNLITLSDIKSLYYIPKDISERITHIKNKKDWGFVFSTYKDKIGKKTLKQVA